MYFRVGMINQLKKIRTIYFRIRLKCKIYTNKEFLRIIVGAAATGQSGWISTDYPILDLTSSSSFAKLFGGRRVKAFLAEHVWEHLTEADCIKACSNCFQFLELGGYLRVAVPDGFHPNEDYISRVKPGGYGAGSEDHKTLHNYKTLPKIFIDAGFEVKLLEWFDEKGQFHYAEWLVEDGFIERSTRFDERNINNSIAYTSLIFDAVKK
jgi:predicted SAM-dependent methyltransferase